jgi:biopolymer transport protein ExbD
MNLETLRAAVDRGQSFDHLLFHGHTPRADGSVGSECLSQWFAASFELDGVRYATAEHFMMAGKARPAAIADGRMPVVRTVLTIALAGLVAGCGSKNEESSGGDDPARARAMSCIAYQSDYWRGVATADDPAPPDLDRYACAGLYRKRSCPAAWSDDAADPVAALAVACAEAYCGDLPDPKPALCKRGPDAFKPADRVPALVELDRAILVHELGDAGLAQQLSARLRLFEARREQPVSIDLPRATSGIEESTYLVVAIDRAGTIYVGSEKVDRDALEARLREALSGDADLELMIDADRDVAHAQVVEVMAAAKRAGFETIGMATRQPRPQVKPPR